jgi:hypothetical protein
VKDEKKVKADVCDTHNRHGFQRDEYLLARAEYTVSIDDDIVKQESCRIYLSEGNSEGLQLLRDVDEIDHNGRKNDAGNAEDYTRKDCCEDDGINRFVESVFISDGE